MKPEIVDKLILQALELFPISFASNNQHNVYFTPINDTLALDDPRRALQRSAKKAIAFDQIPVNSPIRQLYECDDFIRFVAAALEKKTLYRSADPLDACEMVVFEPSDELGWHFDNSEFSVTVMFQPADHGGEFQYVPGLRTPENEGYSGVKELLQGKRDNIITPHQTPGTLSLFCGRYAIHRVTKVQGDRPRINAVLTYGEEPGMKLTELTRKLFYGRNG